MAQTKPQFLPTDIWASTANAANKTKPNQAKLESGWQYGEKPPHNEFNWWWELVGQMLVHIQQSGVPEWDQYTEYNVGALTLFNGIVYQWEGVAGTTNAIPGIDLNWKVLPTAGDITLIQSDITLLKTTVDEIICALAPLAGKGLLFQETWNATTGVLQLNTVSIGTITTACGNLLI